MTKYQAPNGEILIAINDVQEAAFENAGLEKIDDKPKRQPKTDE